MCLSMITSFEKTLELSCVLLVRRIWQLGPDELCRIGAESADANIFKFDFQENLLNLDLENLSL
jgi:hypothetical protein